MSVCVPLFFYDRKANVLLYCFNSRLLFQSFEGENKKAEVSLHCPICDVPFKDHPYQHSTDEWEAFEVSHIKTMCIFFMYPNIVPIM